MKSYRPFTLDEFKKEFQVNSYIHYRNKKFWDERIQILTDISEIKRDLFPIHIGNYYFALGQLFRDFEIYDNGEWKPFGVQE